MLYGPRLRSQPHVTPHERMSKLGEALQTADRLRTQRVFMGTMQLWESLLDEAKQFLSGPDGANDEELRALTLQLDAVVALRRLNFGRPARPSLVR